MKPPLSTLPIHQTTNYAPHPHQTSTGCHFHFLRFHRTRYRRFYITASPEFASASASTRHNPSQIALAAHSLSPHQIPPPLPKLQHSARTPTSTMTPRHDASDIDTTNKYTDQASTQTLSIRQHHQPSATTTTNSPPQLLTQTQPHHRHHRHREKTTSTSTANAFFVAA